MVSFSKRSEEHNQEDSDKERRKLTLHNDDVNSFDHVIDVLCEICEHDAIQAEQCAFLTHYNGECQIKIGSFDELLPIKAQLLEKKLSVTLD
ncbi:ATP-dependent Clp protease adaptor ClpS [Carboxylicivirga sp. N1Y90]|uniref:ATP-dependent Clp protease adaptor ClpS n=1 Tax=Carboxylicivirga fragile TaxID=3417571 RepID=UPI003D3411B2|nr:ATP-dependent Clp protease adaptor ClpS [Marinilabiliaceae bacterium N1Y90]